MNKISTGRGLAPRVIFKDTRRRVAGGALAVGLLAVIAVSLSGCGPSVAVDQASANTQSSALPPNAASDYNRAESLRSAGHCDRAIPLYLSAILKNSIYSNAYSGLGFCYQTIGAFGAAIAEYDKAISIDPTNFGLYIARAGAEANNGTTGAATADDLTALRLALPQVPTYVSIAQSFASFGDFAHAVQAYDAAIARVPGDPSLYEQRAGIYVQMHDNARAFADYQRAIKVAPFLGARASVYSDLANVYDQMQDFNSAYRAIATAIQLQPSNASYYAQSGNIHRDNNDLIAALKLYDQTLKRVSVGDLAATTYESKGDILAQLGQTQQAIKEYRQALRLTNTLNPTDKVVIPPQLKSKIKSLTS